MRAALDRLHHVHVAGHADLRAVRALRALTRRVLEAEIHLVHVELDRQLVDQRLDRVVRARRAGGAVGGVARAVAEDVVAVHLDVRDVVRGERGVHAANDRGAGEPAGLEEHAGLRGDDRAVLLRADLAPRVHAGRRAGRLEHLGAGHPQLDGATGLLR